MCLFDVIVVDLTQNLDGKLPLSAPKDGLKLVLSSKIKAAA